tara:strand:+ start:112 stop:927 length:816 start_codon:yes stop_codon:yes gene_type:complete
MVRYILYPSGLGQKAYGLNQTPFILKSLISGNSIKQTQDNIIKYNGSLKHNIRKLYETTRTTDKLNINIGGDHSMSIATVASSLNTFKDLKVIWFDAHPDINTIDSSKTKNMHGTPLSFLTGLDYDNDFKFISNKLKFDNLLYVGLRELDHFEEEVIKTYNINTISCEDINTNTESSIEKINDFIGNSPTHVSFDVDCLDPSIINCTGTKVKDGMLLEPTKQVLDNILDTNVVSIDITELNLTLGTRHDKETSLNNTIYLFDRYFDAEKLN